MAGNRSLRAQRGAASGETLLQLAVEHRQGGERATVRHNGARLEPTRRTPVSR